MLRQNPPLPPYHSRKSEMAPLNVLWSIMESGPMSVRCFVFRGCWHGLVYIRWIYSYNNLFSRMNYWLHVSLLLCSFSLRVGTNLYTLKVLRLSYTLLMTFLAPKFLGDA